ncbi:MAG: DUF4330 domain-containing protein [Cyanobacterium sp. T60_A2020_053]|nr:DUF4330 domain-containing protein [Cyanobacterium sp. T60_A2020_053]
MKIIDSKGRLFGKINLLDLGALMVVILALVGIFIVPGSSGSLAQVVGGTTGAETVKITLLVRGLASQNSSDTVAEFNQDIEMNVIVRNEPAGKVKIAQAEELPNNVVVNQPDGTVKALLDPRPIVNNSTDMILTMTSTGQNTNDGYVVANQKVKIGTVLELDNPRYNFRGTVIGVETAD